MRKINITHIYPDLLNLYGDKGNIASLKCRLLWRGIEACVTEVLEDDLIDLSQTDILFIGGGADREMEIVCGKLQKNAEKFKKYAENNGVILAVCGGFQLLGKTVEIGSSVYEGLGILDIETKKSSTRMMGNLITNAKIGKEEFRLTGFENHDGETFIGSETPMSEVVLGYGNLSSGGFEGAVKGNIFATYMHGPLLPKNPKLCDIILKRAIIKKYGEIGDFMPLSDDMEDLACENLTGRLL